jgi:hypothetical protein
MRAWWEIWAIHSSLPGKTGFRPATKQCPSPTRGWRPDHRCRAEWTARVSVQLVFCAPRLQPSGIESFALGETHRNAKEVMSLRISLSVSLLGMWLLAGWPESAFGQPMVSAEGSKGCSVHGGRQPVQERCVVVESAPGTPQVLSDHGMTVGEPYDAQGNLIDRLGNIVARPGRQPQQVREVFVRER